MATEQLVSCTKLKSYHNVKVLFPHLLLMFSKVSRPPSSLCLPFETMQINMKIRKVAIKSNLKYVGIAKHTSYAPSLLSNQTEQITILSSIM